MHALKSRVKHLGLTIGLFITLAFVAVAPVAADTATASLTITGGSLTYTVTTATPSAGSVAYSSSQQTATYALGVNVNDARGLLLTDPASGWKVTITSTQFTATGATPLPTTASQILVPATSACTTTASCTASVNTVGPNYTVPAGATAPTATKFFSTGIGTGAGTSTVSASVTVTIPAFQEAGAYSSTLTIATVAGP